MIRISTSSLELLKTVHNTLKSTTHQCIITTSLLEKRFKTDKVEVRYNEMFQRQGTLYICYLKVGLWEVLLGELYIQIIWGSRSYSRVQVELWNIQFISLIVLYRYLVSYLHFKQTITIMLRKASSSTLSSTLKFTRPSKILNNIGKTNQKPQ